MQKNSPDAIREAFRCGAPPQVPAVLFGGGQWSVNQAGRLMREGRCDDRELAALRKAFRRAFTHDGVAPLEADFNRVLDTERLTHAQLLEWAKRPESLLENEYPAQVDCAATSRCLL